MSKETKLPTALESLNECIDLLLEGDIDRSDFIKAMEEHTRLHTSDLKKQLEDKDMEIERRIEGYNNLHEDLVSIRDKYDQQLQVTDKLREALEKTQKIQEVIDECTPLDMLCRINSIVLEALKQQ